MGAHAVVRAVGVRPWWLIVPATRWDRKHDVVATPSRIRVANTIALLAALGLVAAVGVLRRRIDVTAAALIGLALCAALGAVAAQPTTPVLAATVAYSLWWGSQCGMWVWLILAWSACLSIAWAARGLAARHGQWLSRSGARSVPALACIAGLASAGIAGTAAAAAEKPDQHVALYRPIATIDARLNRTLAPGRAVRYDGTLDLATQPFKAAIRYDLARRGLRVLSKGAAARNGDWYELDHRPYDTVVTLTDRRRRPGRRASLLIRANFSERGAAHSVYAWISHRNDAA